MFTAKAIFLPQMKRKAEEFLKELSTELSTRNLLVRAEISTSDDIHGYFALQPDGALILHVQVFPSRSDNRSARVFSRLLDAEKHNELKKAAGTLNTGAHHSAVVDVVPGYEGGQLTSWDLRREFLQHALATIARHLPGESERHRAPLARS